MCVSICTNKYLPAAADVNFELQRHYYVTKLDDVILQGK